MKKLLKKRTGFTLIELLIVIIIIGILAGSMMLVAGSGTDKAEATKIVSDLQTLKSAALMYYADHTSTTTFSGNQIASLDKYADKDLTTTPATFSLLASDDWWYVGREVTGAATVKDKLYDMKDDVGLLGSAGNDQGPTGEPGDYNKEGWAWMRAR